MVKHFRLYGFFTILGITLSAVLIVFMDITSGRGLTFIDFFVSWLACFIISGIVALGISKGEPTVKHSRFFWFITVLGIVLVAIVFTIMFDNAIYNYIWELLSPIQHLLTCLLWFCLLGGPFFLTVGIVGIGRQYIKDKDNRKPFTVIAVVIIQFCILFAFLAILRASLPIGY